MKQLLLKLLKDVTLFLIQSFMLVDWKIGWTSSSMQKNAKLNIIGRCKQVCTFVYDTL